MLCCGCYLGIIPGQLQGFTHAPTHTKAILIQDNNHSSLGYKRGTSWLTISSSSTHTNAKRHIYSLHNMPFNKWEKISYKRHTPGVHHKHNTDTHEIYLNSQHTQKLQTIFYHIAFSLLSTGSQIIHAKRFFNTC